jgi:hypothetical protein
MSDVKRTNSPVDRNTLFLAAATGTYCWPVGRSTGSNDTAYRTTNNGPCAFVLVQLCTQETQTTEHLFLSCVFGRQVWSRILHPVGLQALVPASGVWGADWIGGCRAGKGLIRNSVRALILSFCSLLGASGREGTEGCLSVQQSCSRS